jgi:saccharopine dehydrogenase (NAD+, L-lysine forming)
MVIGIRREDKNKWERRIPLVPKDLRELKDKFGIDSIVQSSTIRIYKDEEFIKENLIIDEDLSPASVVFSIKEIPMHIFQKGKTYVFFSHVFKGQWYNIPMLKKLMELECNLIDYERILDDKNRRLIFFGKYAGNAGMIETLYLYGRKLKIEGFKNPFERIKQPYQYSSLEEAKEKVKKISSEIRTNGLPKYNFPIVVGFLGYGNVSKGAQEIFDLFPHETISPESLFELESNSTFDSNKLYKVVFKEEDLFRRKDNQAFNLQDYYNHPELYESKFENYIRFISILINCIFWVDKYPRLITKEYLQNRYCKLEKKRLKVIGDISCDINGSIEITHKITKPDNPAFTYNFINDSYDDGIHDKDGITVMAVDNLPCEFPKESSAEFSSVLKNFVYDITRTNFCKNFDELELPDSVKKALILHKGQLTKDYQYLNKYLDQEIR